jgi:RNA polymerase sigma-70 factor, ECF subfamily
VLKRLLYRLGLEPAEVEDLAQDSLVRIWRGSPGFRGGASVSTWACRIAINLGLSSLRARRRRAEQAAPDQEPAGDPAAEAERRREAVIVRSAVQELPEQLRVVIVLREFEDLSYRDIAELLEIPIGTVMSRLHSARARLRHRLQPLRTGIE